MWRDKENRKGLTSVLIEYEILGLNQDRLIAELKKRDFTLYNIKKLNNKAMLISVSLRESTNFFAITKNLCYNIKKIRTYGKGLPIYKLAKNVGLFIGALCFLALSVISNDYLFDFEFTGSGSIYKGQVLEYLEERGIEKFSRFSSFDTARLEDEILAISPNLTFVSVGKRGNTLSVYMTLKKDSQNVIMGKSLQLLANESGIVESIKVYRGTALVGVGDAVKEGDMLVEGYVYIKEERVQTGVLAYVTLLKTQTFSYRLDGSDKGELAKVLAEQELPTNQVISSQVSVKQVSGKQNLFEYLVTVEYRIVLYAE